jgi:hypothetical protein
MAHFSPRNNNVKHVCAVSCLQRRAICFDECRRETMAHVLQTQSTVHFECCLATHTHLLVCTKSIIIFCALQHLIFNLANMARANMRCWIDSFHFFIRGAMLLAKNPPCWPCNCKTPLCMCVFMNLSRRAKITRAVQQLYSNLGPAADRFSAAPGKDRFRTHCMRPTAHLAKNQFCHALYAP